MSLFLISYKNFKSQRLIINIAINFQSVTELKVSNQSKI